MSTSTRGRWEDDDEGYGNIASVRWPLAAAVIVVIASLTNLSHIFHRMRPLFKSKTTSWRPAIATARRKRIIPLMTFDHAGSVAAGQPANRNCRSPLLFDFFFILEKKMKKGPISSNHRIGTTVYSTRNDLLLLLLHQPSLSIPSYMDLLLLDWPCCCCRFTRKSPRWVGVRRIAQTYCIYTAFCCEWLPSVFPTK